MITRGSGNSRNRCPHQPPSSYPPESPTPPDCEKLKSWYRRLSKNRVKCVVGVRTRVNDELAGETSTQKSRNLTNRCPLSPPRFIPPWGPPSGKTGNFLFIGDVMYRKITSDFACGCTPTMRPKLCVMSQSSDVSKSRDFQMVVFCEQMGCHFCNFGGVPLQPPV